MTTVGDLREPIVFHTREQRIDTATGSSLSEEFKAVDDARDWAHVVQISPVRQLEQRNATGAVAGTHTFTVRHRDDVGAEHYILWSSRWFRILTIGSRSGDLGKFMTFVTEQVIDS